MQSQILIILGASTLNKALPPLGSLINGIYITEYRDFNLNIKKKITNENTSRKGSTQFALLKIVPNYVYFTGLLCQ